MCILCVYFMLLLQHAMLVVHVATDKRYIAELVQNNSNENFPVIVTHPIGQYNKLKVEAYIMCGFHGMEWDIRC